LPLLSPSATGRRASWEPGGSVLAWSGPVAAYPLGL
jgi:hypothetical protein